MSSVFSETNEHALATITASTEKREVIAADDIRCAESGVLLWAKGKSITPQLQDKLLRRKLTKPIEMSLTVANGLNGAKLAEIAQPLLDNHDPLTRLAGHKVAKVMQAVSEIDIQGPVQLLMTSAGDRNDGTLEHAVAVCMVATSLGLRAGWPDSMIERVTLASLLHDIGELYINPEYLTTKRELEPHEWLHVVAHPKVGAMLIEEMTSYPPHVADMVSAHHERMDGTGYPRQLSGSHFSREAQLVSIAETITNILMRRDNALCRAAFALKLILREYDPTLVGLLTPLADPDQCHLPENFNLNGAMDKLQKQSEQLKSAVQTALSLSRTKLPPKAKLLADRCFSLTSKLYASLTATGALQYCTYKQDPEGDEAEVLLSLDIIPSEIRWRMRNLARDIEMAARHFSESERDAFRALETVLTGHS